MKVSSYTPAKLVLFVATSVFVGLVISGLGFILLGMIFSSLGGKGLLDPAGVGPLAGAVLLGLLACASYLLGLVHHYGFPSTHRDTRLGAMSPDTGEWPEC